MNQEPIKGVDDMLGILFRLVFVFPIYLAIWMVKLPILILVKLLFGPLALRKKTISNNDALSLFGLWLLATGK